ncbi:hypothetical protein BDY19DRAFT_246782 [Irpex rosettiformis]|uniref:Uncharacterized protein n=1 Tax=Irpex rosettiformis TaxID=378272 RepID=A0ACB8TZ26_9APHY|nr:hypothetical protein BDY19DRAFT_246782 [Irpex rosettiformis]
MLEVEDWTQPPSSTKRRRPSTKKATESHTPRKSSPEPTLTAEPTPESTPGPPDPDTEVEEVFPARSPTPHLPSRALPNSPSTSAGPSSLSRLLAQAPVEDPSVARTSSSSTVSPPEKHPFPSPPTSSPRQPSPALSSPQGKPSSPHTISPRAHAVSPPRATVPLPGRPGSRASRMSSSSKFSGGRIPFAGTAGSSKAIATTALASDLSVAGSPSSIAPTRSTGSETVSPSPEGSPTEGMSGFLPNHQRRRPSSYHPNTKRESSSLGPGGLPTIAQVIPGEPGTSNPKGGPAASLSARVRLASLASSWGVSFARRRASESASPQAPVDSNGPSS